MCIAVDGYGFKNALGRHCHNVTSAVRRQRPSGDPGTAHGTLEKPRL
jgi:hypothetical protein